MNEVASTELADFLRFCRSERRLAPMTCSAYERDVSACLAYLQGEGIEALAEAKVTHLRAFPRQRAEHEAGRIEPGTNDGGIAPLHSTLSRLCRRV
ncbi:MAG: site-specific integrase [Gaiellaceae bacterium]